MSANETQVGGGHYKALRIQTWDFITANEIPFLEGNAIKYLVRHKGKGGRADLEKALHYIQKAIEVYYPEAGPAAAASNACEHFWFTGRMFRECDKCGRKEPR